MSKIQGIIACPAGSGSYLFSTPFETNFPLSPSSLLFHPTSLTSIPQDHWAFLAYCYVCQECFLPTSYRSDSLTLQTSASPQNYFSWLICLKTYSSGYCLPDSLIWLSLHRFSKTVITLLGCFCGLFQDWHIFSTKWSAVNILISCPCGLCHGDSILSPLCEQPRTTREEIPVAKFQETAQAAALGWGWLPSGCYFRCLLSVHQTEYGSRILLEARVQAEA